MSSQGGFVLTRRLADGTVEWIPLEIPHRVVVGPGEHYTLLDRANYEAPQMLMAQRQGEDLIVEVSDTEVLVLEGFFATRNVAFHPTTDVAGGAGAFGNPPIDPESPVLSGSPDGEQVVWTSKTEDSDAQVARSDPGAGGAQNGGAAGSALLWGGLAA
ncbi:MAG: hypothetical protein ACNA7W_07730, partial [Pseudomonadales bacterium]